MYVSLHLDLCTYIAVLAILFFSYISEWHGSLAELMFFSFIVNSYNWLQNVKLWWIIKLTLCFRVSSVELYSDVTVVWKKTFTDNPRSKRLDQKEINVLLPLLRKSCYEKSVKISNVLSDRKIVNKG